MHILDNGLVSYCNVIRHQNNNIETQPGILYEDKIFIKYKFFFPEQRQEAIEYSRNKFLDARGQTMYILLEDNLGLTLWVEDSCFKLSDNKNRKDIHKTINLEEVVAQMRSVGGVRIKDRRHNLILYPKCFIGREAVEWMRVNLNLSVEQAIGLGQRLIHAKFIHHVTDEHPFLNDFLFYRFYWDEI